MGGGAGGISFLGGLAQGVAAAAQQKSQDEYKKAMTNKLKNELDLEGMKMKAMKIYMANPNDMTAAAMAGLDPTKLMIAQAMGGGNISVQTGMPTPNQTPQQDVTLPGYTSQTFGDVSEPVTFPGKLLGLTPPPQQNNPVSTTGISQNDMMQSLLMKEGLIPSVVSRAPYQKLNEQTGAVHNYVINSLGKEMDLGQIATPVKNYIEGTINGLPAKIPLDQWGRQVNGLSPIQQPVSGVPIEQTLPGGATQKQFINPYNSAPITQQGQQQQGTINFTIDPTKPGAIEEAQRALKIIQQKGPAGALKPSGGGVQTSPGAMDLPIKDEEISYWINPKNMQSPDLGTTPKEAAAAGFKRMTSFARANLDAMKGVESITSRISDLMEKVFPKSEKGVIDRAGGALSRTIGSMLQTNPDAAELNSLIQGTLAPTVRALGEKGALSDTDIKRAISLMPVLTDSGEVAWRKQNGLIKMFNEIKLKNVGSGTDNAPSLSLQPKNKKQTPSNIDWNRYYK